MNAFNAAVAIGLALCLAGWLKAWSEARWLRDVNKIAMKQLDAARQHADRQRERAEAANKRWSTAMNAMQRRTHS
jgi:hypothetical protein